MVPLQRKNNTRSRKPKYGYLLGYVAELATEFFPMATQIMISNLYGKPRDVLAYERVFILKTLKCPVRVVWVYHKVRWIALFTTDLSLSVEQIIQYYGAR